jgi:hypothetical protein
MQAWQNTNSFALYNVHEYCFSVLPPQPEQLPPSDVSAKHHIFRVHLQVVQWRTLTSVRQQLEEWGWKQYNGHYIPRTTNLLPAPVGLNMVCFVWLHVKIAAGNLVRMQTLQK